ncbi:MAG: hypothetical protein K8T91_24610 [Planctomycetes bacterium]|nr:hypothetical protein [Planctomycetota bacterium]
MLACGNHKLGCHWIWSFSLPSGTLQTCPGMTPTCHSVCYAAAMESYRSAVALRYRRNLILSRQRRFGERMRALLVAHAVRILRIHVGGDFFSVRYTRKWLRIIRQSPRTRFYFYTRSWRNPAIRMVIDRMARLPNCRVWYSVDRDTGVPAEVPARVRVAWLMSEPTDLPPPGTDLVFRVRRLRRVPDPAVVVPVCPTEDGQSRAVRVTCERCGLCWRPLPVGRTALTVIDPSGPGRCS